MKKNTDFEKDYVRIRWEAGAAELAGHGNLRRFGG
jgi:hypothetical protein